MYLLPYLTEYLIRLRDKSRGYKLCSTPTGTFGAAGRLNSIHEELCKSCQLICDPGCDLKSTKGDHE